MTNRRAAAYTRVANAEDASQRLADQEQIIRQWAVEKQHEIAQVYSDIASGNTDQRPGFQQLIAGARAKEFDVVVVADLTRLFRRFSLLHDYYFLLHDQYGIYLVAVNRDGGAK